MLLARARFILMLTWVVGSTPAIIIVFLQTQYQTYGRGEHWDRGLLWLLPAVLPQIATVLIPSVIQRPTRKTPPVVRPVVFWALLVISLLYLTIVYSWMRAGIFEYKNENWDYVCHACGWPFL